MIDLRDQDELTVGEISLICTLDKKNSFQERFEVEGNEASGRGR